MSDFLDLVRDPEHREKFEKLLRLAAGRGDADLVIERLSWGVDPNGQSAKGRTALIANVRGPCPSADTIKSLLKSGADPNASDHSGLTALDYARRKLMRLQLRSRKPTRKSPSLDENNQLQIPEFEQAALDRMRRELLPDEAREFVRLWWKERLRAARLTFNDSAQVEAIVELLEGAGGQR